MKRMKRIVSILLAMVMVLGMSMTVFAEETKGSITINGSAGTGQEGTEVSVKDKTFVAYQILTAELANGTDAAGGIVYRVPEALKAFYATYFGLDSTKASFDQDVTNAIAGLNADGIKKFTVKVLEEAKTVGAYKKSVTGDNDDSVIIDDLPLGYYVVEDGGTATPISALALTTTAKDASVNIKASRPVIDKKIDGDSDTDPDTEDLVETNNASVGDKIPYVVTTNIPDMSGYEKYYFIVNDTMSKGLTFNNDISIVIKTDRFVEDEIDSNGLGMIELKQGSNVFAPDDVDSMGLVEGDYTVEVTENADGTTGIEIVFKDFIKYRGDAEVVETENGPVVTYPDNLAGAEIIITYSATLNEDAVIGVVGNPNTVQLTYSNNPNVNDEGDPTNPDKPNPENPNPPVGTTDKKETRTYVTGIQLTKIDENGKHLAGAQFQIEGTRQNIVLVSSVEFVEAEDGEYWLLKDGTYTTTDPVKDKPGRDEDGNEIIIPGTENLYDEAGKKYNRVVTDTQQKETEQVKVNAVVDASGVLRFNGLAAGMYTITELKAPNGYNLLKNPITIKIDCEVPEKLELDGGDKNNCKWTAAFTLDELNDEQFETMSEKSVVELLNDRAMILGSDVTLNELQYDATLNLFTQDIENRTGSLLPSTGGIGTTIFYVTGSILVLAAVVLLVTKKRMVKEK